MSGYCNQIIRKNTNWANLNQCKWLIITIGILRTQYLKKKNYYFFPWSTLESYMDDYERGSIWHILEGSKAGNKAHFMEHESNLHCNNSLVIHRLCVLVGIMNPTVSNLLLTERCANHKLSLLSFPHVLEAATKGWGLKKLMNMNTKAQVKRGTRVAHMLHQNCVQFWDSSYKTNMDLTWRWLKDWSNFQKAGRQARETNSS